MLLHVQHIRARPVHGDAMNTMPDLDIRIGEEFRSQSPVDGLPSLSGIIGSKDTRSRDGDEDAVRVARIQEDRVQTQATSAWLPLGPGAMTAQPFKLLPGLAAISRTKQSSVFDSGIDCIRSEERR